MSGNSARAGRLPRKTIWACVAVGVALIAVGLAVAPALSIVGGAVLLWVPFVVLLAVARERPTPPRSAVTDQFPLGWLRGGRKRR